MAVYCPQCGAEVDATAKFCDQCGTSQSVAPARLPTRLLSPRGLSIVIAVAIGKAGAIVTWKILSGPRSPTGALLDMAQAVADRDDSKLKKYLAFKSRQIFERLTFFLPLTSFILLRTSPCVIIPRSSSNSTMAVSCRVLPAG